jgi:hypothetical protein
MGGLAPFNGFTIIGAIPPLPHVVMVKNLFCEKIVGDKTRNNGQIFRILVMFIAVYNHQKL